MSTTKGYTRPLSAKLGFYSAQRQLTWSGMQGNSFDNVSVANTDIPSTPRAFSVYNDFYDATLVVCGGSIKIIGGRICVLADDTESGGKGMYLTKFSGWFPVKSSDTVNHGTALYWDATNYEFTTTSSGNTAGAVAKYINLDGTDTLTQTITTATLGSLPAGKFVHVMID